MTLKKTAWDFHLIILGSPTAQGRARATRFGKHARVYDDPKSAKKKQDIAIIVHQQAPGELLTGPLQVDIEFLMPRPIGHYGTGRNAGRLKEPVPHYHIKRPDIDNLRKLIMDALTGVFWKDDSQICMGKTIKVYTERPRTEVFIKVLDEAKDQ